MSPLSTQKYVSAVEKLQALGLIASAIEALALRGPEAVYAELSARGFVWSPDLRKWRKSLKPRRRVTVVSRRSALIGARVRVLLPDALADDAIEDFRVSLAALGYEPRGVNFHEAREHGHVMVYFTVGNKENGNA